jgi:hypothetical protein
MSWKFGGIYFKKDFSEEMDAFCREMKWKCKSMEGEVVFSDAVRSAFNGSALGVINGATLLHNNLMPYDCSFEKSKWFQLDEKLKNFSAQADVLCFFLDGITSTYGLSLFSRKKRIRCRGVFNGEVLFDDGETLAGESDDANEEERIFSLMRTFTGKEFHSMVNDNNLTLRRYSIQPVQ